MARGVNRFALVTIAVITVSFLTPPSATAGDRHSHAEFAVRPVGTEGDIKQRLYELVSLAKLVPDPAIRLEVSPSCYPWKIRIVSTIFWIGETGQGWTNRRSAWDPDWEKNYGGIDDPLRRDGFRPVGFRPHQNPFYVALPYSDMQDGGLKPEAAKVVPWFIEAFRDVRTSVCKGRWVEIRHGIKSCYAQWEDVGPFRADHSTYIFGDDRPLPNLNHGAGIDVSPAVRDYLGLASIDIVDWRFVEQSAVAEGPWSLYVRTQTMRANR